MKTLFRPTNPADEEPLRAFLAKSFGVSPNRQFLRSDILHWKYWARRDDYPEPRSFVLEKDANIVAHAAIWPLQLRSQSEVARGCHMIDWASDPGSPGSGIALVQKFTAMFDFIYAIGGSASTQKVLPAFGFKRASTLWSAARPIRPIRQALTHQYKNWKLPARLLRNTYWAFSPAASVPDDWTLEPSEFVPVENLNGAMAVAQRSPGFFHYLQQCPAIRLSLFRVQRNSHTEGYVLLGFAGMQLRIGGIMLQKNSEENLRAVYALVQKHARETRSLCEVDVMGSTEEGARAATQCGLRISGLTPVFVYQRRGGPSIVPRSFEMMDYDAVCRPYSGPAYWT